ncbi:TonB family protein [Mesorhizobium caraganae]|uniref:energy transducer TonB family protein n=1 Tax=Mesorhizobium caraganae TaxID=483206 RepID=UPI0017864DB3|nr:energy transducer TonB [Mesorhizobium caraganae]MBM2712001.1 TonB family protein [Mesorhizobium caraganae]
MQDISPLPDDAGNELAIAPPVPLEQARPSAGDRKWTMAIIASCLFHAAAAAAFFIAPAGTFDSSNAIQSEGTDQPGADVVGSALDSQAPDAIDVALVTDPQPPKPEAVQPAPPTEAPQSVKEPPAPKPAPEAAEQATVAPDTLTAAIPNDKSVAPAVERSTPPAVQPQSSEAPPAAEPPVDLPAAKPPVPSPRPSAPAGSGEVRGAADGEERDAPAVASKGKKQGAAGNAMEARYSGEIQKKLARANRRVSKAIQEKASNNARVVFVVMADGSIGEVQLAESSGSDELDQFALKLVRQQAPFPPIPPETGRSSWVFRARIGPF